MDRSLGVVEIGEGSLELDSTVSCSLQRRHKHVPPDAGIATFYAGIPYHAPRRRFVDVLGKTEYPIAHEDEVRGSVPGNNKFDFG